MEVIAETGNFLQTGSSGAGNLKTSSASLYIKGSTMSPTNERDAGFCSGSSENEEDSEQAHHTDSTSSINSPPTDVSEDSVEVKLPLSLVTHPAITSNSASTMSAVPKNKRKSSEPIRVVSEFSVDHCAPIKKRIRFENDKLLSNTPISNEAHKILATVAIKPIEQLKQIKQENGLLLQRTLLGTEVGDTMNPFRPWAAAADVDYFHPAESFRRHPGVTTLHRMPSAEKLYNNKIFLPQEPVQEEPMSLVAKKQSDPTSISISRSSSANSKAIKKGFQSQKRQMESIFDSKSEHNLQPLVSSSRPPSIIDDTSSTASSYHLMNSLNSSGLNLSAKMMNSQENSANSSKNRSSSAQSSQRNYKNMTRERRIEANARERTRVHTISAAFDKLRHTIPSYSNTQKLSKLSVLRIACSYILSLSRVAGLDYSQDQSEPSIADCIESVTKTIQTEGKLRKKKDE